jgi:4'-phosphopantetheinyl transferase EntD
MMLGERFILDGAEIVVVPIDGDSLARYHDLLGAEDMAYIASLASPRRRAESAAWRAVVRERLGKDVSIKYNEAGAPIVDGNTKQCHIGVTHTAGFAAVIFSDSRCAIDMESRERDFDRVASRFISPEEAALPKSNHPLFKCALWCAKETLYKSSNRRELDLLEDIKITSTDLPAGKLMGAILSSTGIWQAYNLNMRLYKEKYIIVYIIQS